MTHLAKHQKTEAKGANGFALLSALLLKNVLDYLTNIGFCRAVCKEGFLPLNYVTSAVFLPNSLVQNVSMYLYRRRHVTRVTFDQCTYLNSQMLSSFTYYQTAVDTVIVKRCPNVNFLPFDDIIEDNGTSFLIRKSGRNVRVEFQGCWQLFHVPKPTMSPEQILDIATSCFHAGTFIFHLAPFLFSTSTSIFDEYSDIFASFYNDINFRIKDRDINGDDAVLLLSSSVHGSMICILKKRDDCWTIKTVFKKSIIPMNW